MTTGDGIKKALKDGRVTLGKKISLPSLFEGQGTADDQPGEQSFVLPYPPTMNTYWRSCIVGKGPKAHVGVFVSKEGKDFRKAVHAAFRKQNGFTMKGPLDVAIAFCPPDERDRDWDNPIKPLMDALQRSEEDGFAGAYFNDNQIKHADVWMRSPVRGGITRITIRQL